ncbi:hypothetical protein ScPMuIL_011997 [Solemya velum]
MDERHWWIAGKIQETFKIGGYDNPTLLEDFMCEEPTLAKINRFLKSGGPCRLFFYSQKPENGVLSARELHVTGSLASLKDVDLDNVNILYFLRNVVEKDVDATHMERDIFCGELKHNTIETLTTLLSDIYIPLIKAQKEWGECNQEGQAGLTYSMDKFLTALNESTASMQSSKQLMLKQPENIVLNDFKQQRAAALDPQLIGQYEELVIQWMNTIEAILVDTSDERFMDPNAGPLSELERWRRRQRLLTSITEQLKGKECKAVIGVLITAKSRFLKRWKTVDAGITDAMNDTKDKVKYLESLRRHFDQLYSDATPSSIINNAITGIASGVRQMDSISRYYARTGFLGLVFTKVTNQLVLACKEYLKESTLTFDDVDELWEKIGQEIQHRDMLPSADPQHRMLRNHVEAKFKGSRAVKSKEGGDLGIQDDTLYGRLKACLTLQVFYRETLRSLRDSLGQSQNLSHYSSLSSVVAIAGGLSSRSKQGNVQSRLSSQNSVSPKKGMSTLLSDNVGHGVSIADEDAILSHMDTFCERIRQLMDVINTLALYNKMVQTAAGIPRPRKEDLTPEEPEEEKYPGQKHGKKIVGFQEPEESKVAVKFNVQCPSPDRGLGAIAEDAEETAEGHTLELELQKDEKNFDPSSEQADEAYDVVTTHTGLSEDELACLRKYFSLENNEEAPSISGIIADHLQRMTKSMSESVTTKTMLDVESKDKDRFLEHYDKFQAISLELEKFLTAYLHAIFMRKMKTQQGLDIITRFAPVQNIHGIRNTVSEKFVEIFNWYESDLEDVHVLYEANKNAPQLVRNAPPVAGAIHWARQLLKRIEDPMKVFRDNKAVNQLGDFGRIVRIYNRLATALVTFESLWFAQWKNRIDQARNGLRATLFVHHPVTNKIVVNADERVLELIHEAKWLTRLDIQIPETAVAIMQQESRFKSYKSHLQLVLTDYQLVCESIPAPLRGLFTSHMEFVELQLQPGLSTLAWNSMNIDAFLHQIHVATKRLKDLGEKVSHIMETKVFDTIEKIRSFYLFDYERAFSKSWPPEEFQQSMVKSVRERAVTLQNYVETIMDGLQSVASTLVFRKNETMTKSKKIALMMSEDDMQREKQRVVREEHHVAELITFYRDQVYAAVLSATCMSLVTLAESAGCEGELVRSISQMSARSGDSGASPVPGRRSPGSRAGSASSTGYPHSSLSALSTMTWTTEKTQEATYLQFEVEVKFSIPVIIVEPTLDISQTAVTQVAKAILDANKNVCWSGPGGRENFYDSVSADSIVLQLMSQLATVVEDLDSVVGKHLYHFSYYNFLWKDDMHGNFKEFISAEPGTPHIKKEVERFLDIEKKVLSIPSILPVGPICLHTDPIKDALHGFAMAWKTQFAMVLHEEAKRKLDTAVLYRSNVRNRLELHVQSLDQLNSALHLLEELRDMENKIDGIYLPIENMYAKLREFELRLPQRRGAFEQELDKQVKTFVVEVIQFRNAFDAQGPSVPGIPPAEAVTRLQDFQQRYLVYDAKRNTLDSVSKLFGIVCKPFPELDRTGEELDLLSQLYGLFQKFIRFDNRFRDTLWAEVDLDTSFREVEAYWDECLALPSKLKDWDAYNDLKTKVQTYLEVFPLLNNLASKEIRNRHWLQVMQVTGSSFQLEANVFKLSHLLDIGLIKHRSEIEDICRGAGRELELEIKMRMTEEEWTEQVLSFEHYKRRGPVYLDKVFTERLLEQLEDAQALLANMLTSRYIGPLRDEAASWAEKLKEVAEVLELWLEVQDLWQYLEAVFSNSYAAKELPQEAKRFVRIDKGWAKMMKRAFDTRNVLQCCYGGEVPKAVVLRHIHEELEICFKSLVGYLDNKRRAFPRFYFVSDPVLLAMLSKPNDLESVRPHFRSIFSSLHDVQLKQTEVQKDEESSRDTPSMGSVTPGKKSSPTGLSETPSKVDKRLNEVYNTNPSSITHGMSYLPSEGIVEDIVVMDAVSVSSVDGERLELQDKVTLTDGVEVWLQKLQDSISRSLSSMNTGIIQDYNSGVAMDEWPLKYPAQVCRIGMLYQWTRECEQGISEIKYDRKALQGTLKKYTATIAKLPTCLSKGAWRTLDDPMLPRHKARLECMITQSLYLRDILENLYNRKLREPTDFEWRRSIRCYFQSHEEKMMPLIWILDNHYMYGNEFYGTNAGVALTPLTERCFLTMSQALFHFQGSCVTGPVGVGKTEVVKGLGNILGHFLAMFQCSQQSDPVSIGRLVQGAAMDGCWCVLDEGHSLCKEAMSVLLDHINSVLTALKTRNYFTTLADGQEVCVKRAFSMHMTVNPAASPPNQDLPSDLKAYFRTVNLVKPDLGLILKAKCASMSFKAPFVLGARLKVLTEIARDQLPSMTHHHFSITSLTAVLRRAMQKRKLIKEEKSQDRNDSKMKDETSRSESQASDKQLILPSLNSKSSSSLKMTTGSQRKMATPNPMSQWGKLEHALVCKTLEEVIGPRLTTENMLIFKNILRDIFAGLPDVPVTAQAHSAKSRGLDIEVALEHKALDKNLIPNKTWLQKCIQLYNISQVHHGVIVAGPPGSGKTTCIQTLVEALCTTPRGMSRQSQSSRASNMAETSHKLIRINPLVVNDSALMFGYLNNSHDWVDGIFTSACRKANRNLSTTWLCLDGPINPGWADNFNSILAEDKVLHLKNGDKMFLSDKIIVIFETDNLSDASPTTVSKSGIVFLDKDVVGWKPIAKAWLDSRSPQEIHVLQRSFQKTLDPLINFVLNEARCPLKLSEVGLFSTCLGLLSAMLADNIEIGGELHIERLFLFCLIWTFGGLLDGVDRRGFSDLLKTLSSALPDDDRDICVFDYYVDESGEWDPWISRVPEAVYGDSQDMLGEIFVDTVDTIRTRILMDFAAASGLNVLLVGTPGCGKTTQIGDFMDAQDQQVNVCKRLVFSGASTAEQLQQFVEANIYLRQGYVYGARDNKKLKVFIDDVNLPVPDEYGVQRNNELLRQLLDDKVLCTLQKPFEWKTIEGLTVACAMSMSDHPSVNNQLISERLLRHFAVFNLPAPQDAALKSIVHGILEANVTDNEKPGLEIDLHNHIVRASCDLLSALQDVLRPTPMPGRYHYLFTLKDITQCFQCMKRLPDESMADEHMVVSLWKHEITRIIRDRISRTSDLIWFDETLGKTRNWPKLGTAPLEHFVTFPTDNRQYQRPLTSTGAKHIKIVLQPVKMLRDLHSCLNTHLTRYNEEFGNVRLNVMLSDFIISHIVRMHRVLSFHHGGNLLLIGAVGSHLATLCKLALHVADVPIHKVDTSKCSNFFDGLRSAVRLSGSEGKILTVMFTGRDLEDPVYLDAINSLLISGQYTHLFSNDELEGLLQALGPGMKREFPSMSIDPMKFFVARVKTNLHILICLQPGHQLLRIASSQYPGLLSGCAIQWMCDWPQESLIGEASYFITRYQLTEEFEDLTETPTSWQIYQATNARLIRQLPAGRDLNPKVTLKIVKARRRRKSRSKYSRGPNFPIYLTPRPSYREGSGQSSFRTSHGSRLRQFHASAGQAVYMVIAKRKTNGRNKTDCFSD